MVHTVLTRLVDDCVQLQLSFDSYDGSLNVHVIQARRLRLRADSSYVDPYVKLCLLPGRRYTDVYMSAQYEFYFCRFLFNQLITKK